MEGSTVLLAASSPATMLVASTMANRANAFGVEIAPAPTVAC
jgi:hypothetical protein